MKHIKFDEDKLGDVIGRIDVNGKSIIVWVIKKSTFKKGLTSFYEVWKSEDNGYSGILKPRKDTSCLENFYHESIKDAKEWIINYYK